MKKHLITLLLLIAVIPSVFAQSPQAKWVDRSDELPGMSGGSTGLIIAGAAVGTAAIVAIIVISAKKKNKVAETSTGNNGLPELGLKTAYTPTFQDKVNTTSELLPVQLITGIDQIPNQQASSSLALSVGLRFNF